MHERRLITLIGVAVLLVTVALMGGEDEALGQVPRLFFPLTPDGGVIQGPVTVAPRGATPTEIRCRDPELRSTLVQAVRTNTPYVRVGPCSYGLPDGGTNAAVAYNAGIALAPAAAIEWQAGQGRVCVISEQFWDAGVPQVNALCGAGGPR